LLVDSLSWPYAVALTTLALAVILTAVVRLQQSSSQAWASSLILVVLGLLAVLAGNPLTLLLAWAALDLVELLILIGQIRASPFRERVMIAFSIRAMGILLLLWAVMISEAGGEDLVFKDFSPSANLFVVLAAGLRLGILPLHLPLPEELPLRRGLGTTIRMASTAGSLAVLGRVSSVGIPASFSLLLLILAALAALYGSIQWITAGDELNGRPFWVLGASALCIASAVRSQPAACLAWGLASLLPGSLLFLGSLRHRFLLPLFLIGLISACSLPFTPAWDAAQVYVPMRLSTLAPVFFLAHVLLLIGYVRYSLHPTPSPVEAERWMWVIYPLGLAILPINDLLITYWNQGPESSWFSTTPTFIWGWIGGLVSFILVILSWFWTRRSSRSLEAVMRVWKGRLSLSWLNNLVLGIYLAFRKLIDWITTILEGEGGVLWALVLLAILFTFLATSYRDISIWILKP
jgi:hypothetical protein